MGHRVAAVAAGLLAGAVLLTGCGTFYSEKLRDLPPEASSVEFDGLDPKPAVVWADNGEDWFVITWGSSSCPNAPVSLDMTAPGQFSIELRSEGGSVCTADLGPTTFRIAAPDGVTPADSVVVDIGPGTLLKLEPVG